MSRPATPLDSVDVTAVPMIGRTLVTPLASGDSWLEAAGTNNIVERVGRTTSITIAAIVERTLAASDAR